MLVASQRHRPADLEHWTEQERADAAHGKSKALSKKACAAIEDIGKFLKSGPCYAGVSWGKDSVVLADLCMRAARIYRTKIPLIWVRVDPICNPDCCEVRDTFLAANPAAEYHEIESPCEWSDGEWHAKGTLEAGFIEASVRVGTRRYLSGVRADESGARMVGARSNGIMTATTCRPLTWWTAGDVYAWLALKSLPVHPAYAMNGGGRWDREHIRVASLGGKRGDGMGRAEWESEYYGDVLRRLSAGIRGGK